MAEECSSMMNETETEGSSRSSSVLSLHYSLSPFESHNILLESKPGTHLVFDIFCAYLYS